MFGDNWAAVFHNSASDLQIQFRSFSDACPDNSLRGYGAS